jgi:hypothetical protein
MSFHVAPFVLDMSRWIVPVLVSFTFHTNLLPLRKLKDPRLLLTA